MTISNVLQLELTDGVVITVEGDARLIQNGQNLPIATDPDGVRRCFEGDSFEST